MMQRAFPFVVLVVISLLGACRRDTKADKPKAETFAELRTIKGAVLVTPPGEKARKAYPRERVLDGESVTIPAGGLSWMRRDGGATWLVAGPAKLVLRAGSVELSEGRAFVDTELDAPAELDTPRGKLELSEARASVDVDAKGLVSVYVLRGSARAGNAGRATAGELLSLHADGKTSRQPVTSWDDWTGGLATADPAADPAPFGVGTVGARAPGDKGKPRFSLVVQRLDVRVTIDNDFAITEVDETFVNPTADTVEGLFSFRTPQRAVLHRFGVDRHGELVWGRVKESGAAVRQYESNVYQGSQEDPALLSWAGPGLYNARLYPIQGGATRRVVTRYAEWLTRNGPRGERRLYVYPMAAEGAKGSLPRIEELTVTVDLTHAAAQSVRAGMGGKRDGNKLVVKAFDFVPRADLAVELFDQGQQNPIAYRTPHRFDAADVPKDADDEFAKRVAREEADYLAVPLRAVGAPLETAPGLDLALVIDTSAATEPGALAIARSMASSLLAHLGPEDRAALWAGDAMLRPVAEGSGELVALDGEKRKTWLAGLAAVERGGATDVGALLTEAASKLDPKRRGAIVYVGDGMPSVGELLPKALADRLSRLPASTRILAAAVGSRANVALLNSLVRGAPVETVSDGYGAARSALRLLEAAGRPVWLGAKLDLGPGVERILPRELPALSEDESVLVVGRISGKLPTELKLEGGGTSLTRRLSVRNLSDNGDLRRRWGEGRLAELLAEGAGRSAMVEVAKRFGLVSPFTSLYVPTEREAENLVETDEDREVAELRRAKRWMPWMFVGSGRAHYAAEAVSISAEMDNKEGGTGTRAKGEEGSMGNPTAQSENKRYAVQGPRDNEEPHIARQQALREAQEYGMIGLLNQGAAGDPHAPPAPWGKDQALEAPMEKAAPAAAAPMPTAAASAATGNMFGDEVTDAPGSGGLGLSGTGEGGGGKPDGIGLGNVGSLGHGSGTGTGQGFGSGSGRLGGAAKAKAPQVRSGAATVHGRLPPEVIQRIVRQNFGRFRNCYEQGLSRNPNLEGTINARFVIGRDGAVSNVTNAGSDLPDSGVVSCVLAGFYGLSFPQPEGGVVTVSHPISFKPEGGTATPAVAVAVKVNTSALGMIGHEPRPCGPAADLPFSERQVLWRERLSGNGTVSVALDVYRTAVRNCEASRWDERSLLLVFMVDYLSTVHDRVALWRALLNVSPAAADAVYRFLLLRVQTASDLKQLHDALGFERIQPQVLEALIKKAKDGAERLALLRGVANRFPDDTELALIVLDAYEDAGDDAGGRAWARKLRHRVDATAHVRTHVGEYYLRLSKKGSGAGSKRDADEARRTFGELVEFAPEDPLARRRLGDLLRAHGWYDEAFRQYETLAQLTPDDTSVTLLLASAAQGMGKVEEAVRWSEKAASVGSPDGASAIALAARSTASAFLAWAREDANKGNRKEEAERLLARSRRLAAAEGSSQGGVRCILTWSHPELRPQLWTNALGSPMPAADNLPLYGVAQAYLPASPLPVIELRLDPEDAQRAARLDAKATLTMIVAEGTAEERIRRMEVGFRDAEGKPTDKVSLRFENNELVKEAP
jgi:tetratricopeptide (TPR) repeat protein